MTLKRAKGRIFALFAVMAALLTCATATPALAVNIAPTNNLTFDFNKYLVMNSQANVPPVTFTFTIKAGTAVNATEDSPAIYAGIGNPTASEVAFTSSDQTEAGTPGNPSVSESKYATKKATVDFSGVSFTKPGIYRYVITENESTASGIVNDNIITRILDVYVEYDGTATDTLKVAHYVLHEGTDNPDRAAKSAGFTNTYATNDLTLAKTVTGNQGDRDKYFEFTVQISDAEEGTVYTVNLADAEENPTVDDGSKANPKSLTVGSGGTISGTFYLRHGQSIVIQGLTSDTKYTITEEDYSTDGYETSYVLDSGASQPGRTTTEAAMDLANHAVTFTNNKDGAIPTGILLETTPYLVMGGVVVVGLVALVATRRRRAR